MKHILLIAALLASATTLMAQNRTANTRDYKTALGLKIWNGGGVSLKTFVAEQKALEFIGFFSSNSTRITGLYELHGDLNTEGNFKWYIGFGAHVNLYKRYTGVGLDGVAGLDYKFSNLPLNLALDWQPAFELGSGSFNGFYGNWGGLAIRFTL